MRSNSKPPSVPVNILLVDDNHHGNIARKIFLQQQGFNVRTSLTGEEAWELIEREAFDVVVTDYRMPAMDGLELIRHIRASGRPVATILLSGFAECLGMTEESTGADIVLCKGSKEEEQLNRAVRQLLDRRSRRKPASSQKKKLNGSVARSG